MVRSPRFMELSRLVILLAGLGVLPWKNRGPTTGLKAVGRATVPRVCPDLPHSTSFRTVEEKLLQEATCSGMLCVAGRTLES